jgi:ComF family protein
MPWIGALSSLWNCKKLYKPATTDWHFGAGACLICGGLDARTGGVCDACQADFPSRGSIRLTRTIAAVDAAFAAYRYEFPITSLVKRAKFQQDLSALAALQASFTQTFMHQLGEIDLLVPVPLSPRRFLNRGFNQAGELARSLGKASGKTVRFDLVKRERGGVAQSSLGAAERRENTKGVFRATGPLRGECIALVDDVITTGATCSSLAKILRAAGASRIICLAIAATPLRQAEEESKPD